MAKYNALLLEHSSWQGPVKDRLATPPGSPDKGDRYIVIATASGDWSGKEDDIAYYDGSAWQFITPAEGWMCHVDDEDKYYKYTGSAWEEDTQGGSGGGTDYLTWVIKTANYTASAGDGVFADTATTGAFTLTLPSSASRGDTVAFTDCKDYCETNNLTIGRNGHNINGNAGNLIINLNGAGGILVYMDATEGWRYLPDG